MSESSRKLFIPILRLAQARTAGWLWLASTLVIAFLAGQQLIGWPLQVSAPLHPTAVEGLQTLPLQKILVRDRWDRALVRILKNGHPIPRLPTTDALRQIDAEGFAFDGRAVLLRVAPGTAAEPAPASKWEVRAPWTLKGEEFGKLIAAWALITTLLALLGQPLLIAAFRQIQRQASRPSPPWAALVFIATTLAIAIVIRAGGFWYPRWHNDSPSYFVSIYSIMDGGRPTATPDRPFGYSCVIGPLLRIIPDLRAVVVAHQFASIVAALSCAAVLWWAAARLFEAPLLRSGSRFLAGLFILLFAVNEGILERECDLISEAWVSIYLGLQAVFAWHLSSRPRSLTRAGAGFAALCLAGFLAFFTRPNWGFALACLPLPWLCAMILSTGSWRKASLWAATGAAIFITIAGAGFAVQAYCTPTRSAAALHDRALALVCWHVPLVRPEIERRLSASKDERERAVLREMATVFDQALSNPNWRSTTSYPSLGYDPDFLYTRGLRLAPVFSKLPQKQRVTLCSSLFREALVRRPSVYLHKVALEMSFLFVHPYRRAGISPLELTRSYERSQAALAAGMISPRLAPAYALTLQDAAAQMAQPWTSFLRLASSERTALVFDFLTPAIPWAIGLSASICAVAALWPRWRSAIPWRSMAAPLTVAVWATGSFVLSSLSSAVTQGLDIGRYIQLSAILILLSELLWPLIALAFLLRLLGVFARTKNAAHPTPPSVDHSP